MKTTDMVSTKNGWRTRVSKRKLSNKAIWASVVIGGALLLLTQPFSFYINKSSSSPHTVFMARQWGGSLKRGQYIVFKHPLFAKPLVKRVLGLPGDKVNKYKGNILVGGVDGGRVLERSPRSGRPVHALPDQTIPDNKVFVWAPAPDSFDSRYEEMGLIPLKSIKEEAWPLF